MGGGGGANIWLGRLLRPPRSCGCGQCCPREAAQLPWVLPDSPVALSSGKQQMLVHGPPTCRFVTTKFSGHPHLLLRHVHIATRLERNVCALTDT